MDFELEGWANKLRELVNMSVPGCTAFVQAEDGKDWPLLLIRAVPSASGFHGLAILTKALVGLEDARTDPCDPLVVVGDALSPRSIYFELGDLKTARKIECLMDRLGIVLRKTERDRAP